MKSEKIFIAPCEAKVPATKRSVSPGKKVMNTKPVSEKIIENKIT
jgi:hypothetical protein